jgi:transcriptional regulator with XRE-family HTH domain
MRRIRYEDVVHGAMNESIIEVLTSVPSIRFISKLDDALQARGLTQTKLSAITGLRPATISELISGERSAITKAHFLTVMIALRITDIRELIDIEFDTEVTDQFNREAEEWKKDKTIPLSVKELFMKNSNKLL